MKYDFDKLVDRRNASSVKWDIGSKDIIPMWIADMDFPVASPILEAIKSRADHGIFGYTTLAKSYYDAEVVWWEKRHGFKIEPEWIEVTTGIIPALSAAVQAFTNEGDKVLIQSPVYNYFASSITNNKCTVVENTLEYEDGKYFIDFDDFEVKASDERVKLFILCNPHNPVGRAYTREELMRMGDICLKYNVIVVVDEAHRDLVYSKYKHVPYASLGEAYLMNSVTCTAPSKTFNVAGLKTANIIAADPELRHKMNRSININETIEPSVFGTEALTAAYTQGDEWLDQLLAYLEENLNVLTAYFETHLPQVRVIEPEATYLVWVDCRALKLSSKDLNDHLIKHGVRLNMGETYGASGSGFIRINIACPRETLMEGLRRIEQALKNLNI